MSISLFTAHYLNPHARMLTVNCYNMPKRVQDTESEKLPVKKGRPARPLCEHKKESYQCRDCFEMGRRPSVFCEHKRQRSKCKECLCAKHGVARLNCTQCKENAKACEHSRQKSKCATCNGCIHGRLKYFCKECDGSQICEHNKRRVYCVDCGGKCICIHVRRKYVCPLCKDMKQGMNLTEGAASVQLPEQEETFSDQEMDLYCSLCKETKPVDAFIDGLTSLPEMNCTACREKLETGMHVPCSGQGCSVFVFVQDSFVAPLCQHCKERQEAAAGGAPGGVLGSINPSLPADLLALLNPAP